MYPPHGHGLRSDLDGTSYAKLAAAKAWLPYDLFAIAAD